MFFPSFFTYFSYLLIINALKIALKHNIFQTIQLFAVLNGMFSPE